MPPGSRPQNGPILLRCWRSRRDSRIADLVPIRYGRMLASPFAFYRGAAVIMAVGPVHDAAVRHPRATLR